MDKNTALKQYFGYDSFRGGQERIIDSILTGRDVMGIMPTGGGKSLCYQVPALLLPGITLVISPLISLMKDQVAALRDAGIDAAYINSSLSDGQIRQVLRLLREGIYKIIYIAPERLEADGFAELMKKTGISLVAVDEAHCISQWGQDFRPSYLRITKFISALPKRPVVAAFTATATSSVQRDIAASLELCDPLLMVTGFDRPNLYFDVMKPKGKSAALLSLVKERSGKCGIIYCATRKNVEQVCGELNDRGVSATRYHAGLTDEERRKNQDDFQYDRKLVMVATNAFGMGIDKSNVSYIIHYNMPKSLEAYYQEAGRAGRDGELADCILLYSAGDVATAKYLIEHSSENDELSAGEWQQVIRQEYERLDAMTAYCKTASCLRGYILDYFSQPHSESCGNCGNCLHTYSVQDITVQTQMILSCVKRVKDHLGYSVGASLIANTLRGSRGSRIMELSLNSLSTYGIMSKFSREQICEYIEFLESRGCLRTNRTHSSLELTEKSYGVLFNREKVEMPLRAAPPKITATVKKRPPEARSEAPEGLFEILKAVRTQLAQEEKVPAYIVFSNACLEDMAAKRPRTINEFLKVNGVGDMKAAKYSARFLEAVSEFEGGGE